MAVTPTKLAGFQLVTRILENSEPNDEIWLMGSDYGNAELWIIRDGNMHHKLMEG